MEFEFDSSKSIKNDEKHGINFYEAQNLWRDPFRIEIPAKFVKEPRILVIAEFNNIIWSAVITYRNQKIRIISVRKSRKNEKEIYYRKRIR